MIRASGRDRRQSAYRVLVASDPGVLEAGAGDKWDSGRVASDATAGVAYAGAPLRSGERCWWQVQVWDEDGRRGADSPPAVFEMALLAPEDWAATWIGADPAVSAPLLRKEFRLSGAAGAGPLLRHRARVLRTARQRPPGRRPGAGPGHHLLPQRPALRAGLAGALRRPRRDPAPEGRRKRGGADARPRLVQRRGRRAPVAQPPRALRTRPRRAAATRSGAGRRRAGEGGQRRHLDGLGRSGCLQRLLPRRDLRRPPGAAGLGRARLRRLRLGPGPPGAAALGGSAGPAAAAHPGGADPRSGLGVEPRARKRRRSRGRPRRTRRRPARSPDRDRLRLRPEPDRMDSAAG